MTMALDPSQQQRFGPGPGLNFDYQAHAQPPAFSNPWSSSASPPQSIPATGPAPNGLFVPAPPPGMNPNMMPGKPHPARPSAGSTSSMTSYGSMPVANSSADLMAMNRMQTTSAAFGDPVYATSASPVNGHFAPPATGPYDAMGYTAAPHRQHPFAMPHDDPTRRFSQPAMHGEDRRGFADALDASHGMLAMSQDTPRNIYGSRNDRSSVDSYGFPSTHSTSSSISSTGNFSSYYGDSLSDYSTAGSDIESRTLPRPQGLMGAQMPPAPQSMMGQFSSKVSSSTQKKHKCKVCDKRFTRPSSLQTHMYSHTGEKPFACEVEGCGRHFSVVSNLRRHRKVHRGDAPSEAGSEDHHSD